MRPRNTDEFLRDVAPHLTIRIGKPAEGAVDPDLRRLHRGDVVRLLPGFGGLATPSSRLVDDMVLNVLGESLPYGNSAVPVGRSENYALIARSALELIPPEVVYSWGDEWPETWRPKPEAVELDPLDLDDSLMLCAAHRYCLGRQTYMVAVCIERLRHHWPRVCPTDQADIVRETLRALLDGAAGDPAIDAPAWRDFARWGWDQLSPAKQGLITKQLAWKLEGRTIDEVIPCPTSTALSTPSAPSSTAPG